MKQEKLMTIAEWSAGRFTEASRPTRQVVAKWCNEGSVPAKRIGKKWFIIAHQESQETGDSLVDGVLLS